MDADQGGLNADTPHETYDELLRRSRERLRLQQRKDRQLGLSKVGLGLLAAFFVLRYLQVLHGFQYLLIVAAVFAVLAVLHDQLLARIRSTRALIGFYERGLARLEDRWAGTGEGGERFLHDAHPYARDLDLFGAGSVFELLCIFRTRAGEETLARWLLEPAAPEEVGERQAAARELKGRAEFREKLFTAGDRARLGLHPEALTEWGEQQGPANARTVKWAAAGLAVAWLASLAYGFASGSYYALLAMSSINYFVNGHWLKELDERAEAAEKATADLDLLVQVLRLVETEPFGCERLRGLQVALPADGRMPSEAVKRLDRITNYLEQRRNMMVRGFGINSFLFYSVQWTLAAEEWRKEFGPAIRGWLASVGETEALAAFGCYAFEHPRDVWPEFVQDGACLDAEALAHPLLPEQKAVRNDVKLGDGLQLMVLSGPNMSGKSTFVRGIGVNAVLAQCGAPVRARRLRMSPLAVGASICVLDSLQGGVSRFYAEIKRLKLISDLTRGPIPVLFLLDELLSGTNSHDRLKGTELVVRNLVGHGAIGLVTTHDLALACIPESMDGKARNSHFEDHLEDGRLVFDFTLMPGVVQTSNALKLMESIGLAEEPTA